MYTQALVAAQDLVTEGASVRMAALYSSHHYDLSATESSALALALMDWSMQEKGVLV